MKKLSIYAGSAAFALSLFINTSFAQEKNFSELPPVTITASSSKEVVNAKVSNAFDRLFKESSNAKWYRVDKNFLVTFIQNDQENKALFNQNGNLVYHIKFGVEKHLPADIRHLVKSKYYDQNINRIYNIKEGERDIWVISLEDANDYVMIRVEEMELEETQHIVKAR